LSVVGPVGNLLNATKLLGLDWLAPESLAACIWDRQRLDFLKVDGRMFAHELRDCARHLQWSRAGKRRKDLKGLQLGVDVEASTQLLRTSGKTQVHKGLLRSILSGGVVCGQRAFKAGFSAQPFCKFCSSSVAETVHHLFWECPAWAHIRVEHELAKASWRPDWPPCFSCCGILCHGVVIPIDAAPVIDHAPGTIQSSSQRRGRRKSVKPRAVILHVDECFIAGRIDVYTDGACVHNQISILRRAGFGAWWADNHELNVSKPLEGYAQTNNRAELAAVLHVLRHEPRDVHIKTDSAYVWQGCLKHRHTWAAAGWRGVHNSDLWLDVHELLQLRGASVLSPRSKATPPIKMLLKALSRLGINMATMLQIALLLLGHFPTACRITWFMK